MYLKCLCLTFLLCLLKNVYAQNLIQVNTTEGIVQGSRALDGSYFTFYDIPYAGPTSGENRFKAPTPPPAHTGVYNATNRHSVCAQPGVDYAVEDCLTLSIFTRNVTTLKPVFVWLNAEEYTYSSPTVKYSYKTFVEESIVFVALNFRLSIFGFLCLRVPEAPGNAGLKDIIQGLQWVKNNIANFGGNPNNVILIGHSSGAALVDLITMSPRSENLIHKAIALSGSALAPWAVAYDPIGYANIFGASLAYKNKKPQELATLLKTTNTNLIFSELRNFRRFKNSTVLFAPCLENHNLNPKETVLSEAPINILRSGKFSNIPYIAGFTTREGTLRASEAINNEWLSEMQANFSNFLPVDINVAGNKTIAQEIRQFYFSESPIDMATINDYLDYEGDTLVLVSVIRAARERASTSKNSVRLLEFGFRGTLNSDWQFKQIPLNGARHGAFLNFMFNYDLKMPGDEFIMKSLVSRFSSFAHTGEPMPNNASIIWPAISSKLLNYLYYDGNEGPNLQPIYTEEARANPHVLRMNFWNETYSKYYVAPQAPSSANKAVMAVFLVLLSQAFLFSSSFS